MVSAIVLATKEKFSQSKCSGSWTTTTGWAVSLSGELPIRCNEVVRTGSWCTEGLGSNYRSSICTLLNVANKLQWYKHLLSKRCRLLYFTIVCRVHFEKDCLFSGSPVLSTHTIVSTHSYHPPQSSWHCNDHIIPVPRVESTQAQKSRSPMTGVAVRVTCYQQSHELVKRIQPPSYSTSNGRLATLRE